MFVDSLANQQGLRGPGRPGLLTSRLARRLPAAAHARLGARRGWYVIAHATK